MKSGKKEVFFLFVLKICNEQALRRDDRMDGALDEQLDKQAEERTDG